MMARLSNKRIILLALGQNPSDTFSIMGMRFIDMRKFYIPDNTRI